MKRFVLLLLAAAVAPPWVGGAERLVVQAVDGALDVTARGASLAEVLTRISEETGMRVVHAGRLPASALTLTLKGQSEARAVTSVLHGLGLSYAFKATASGHVETLILVDHYSATGRSPMDQESSGGVSWNEPVPDHSDSYAFDVAP